MLRGQHSLDHGYQRRGEKAIDLSTQFRGDYDIMTGKVKSDRREDEDVVSRNINEHWDYTRT